VYLAKQSEFAKGIDDHPTSGIILQIRVQWGEEEGESIVNDMSIT
jgi:hypothetical protein